MYLVSSLGGGFQYYENLLDVYYFECKYYSITFDAKVDLFSLNLLVDSRLNFNK